MRSLLLFALLPLFVWNNPFEPEYIWGKYSLKFPEGGEIELTFKSDSTFLMSSQYSMATVINEGVYEVTDDSIFLTYVKPAIQNTIDTFTYDNHFIKRKDTLWIIDENEIATGTRLMSDRYYQLEKHYKDGSIEILKEWELKDSSVIIEDSSGNMNIYILRGRRIKKGDWAYYDRQ